MWKIVYSRQAKKHLEDIRTSVLYNRLKKLIELIARDPLATPPPVKSLWGIWEVATAVALI
jgi:hypothetical protein